MKALYDRIYKSINSSIIVKTVVSMTLIFIVTFMVLTVFIVQMFAGQMKQRIVEDQQIIVEKIADTVNYPLDSLITPMITLSRHSATLSLLRGEYDMYSAQWLQSIRDVGVYLTNVNTFSSYILDIAILRPDSDVVYSMSNILERNYNYCNKDWFRDALEKDGVIKYAPPHGNDHYYSSFRGYTSAVTAIYPVVRGGKLLGYILMEVNIPKVSDIFRSGTDSTHSGFLLVDRDGLVIFDYDKNRSGERYVNNAVVQHLKSGSAESLIFDRRLYIARQLPSTSWYVLSETDSSVITKPAMDIIRIDLILLGLCMVILFLVARSITRKMRRPVDDLIQRISSYDGSSSIAVAGIDSTTGEILTIRTKFEEMADKISALISDVYVAQVRRREMELEALINQINPHFLYNVLQLIQTKAVLADNREIEDMIISLGSMLRYTMDRSREKVTLQEEISYIGRYLAFYKHRFFATFDYTVDCEDGLMDCMVMKFVLQPIVENCFKHGFNNKKENAVIRITARREGGDVLLAVWDNGCGITVGRLGMIREGLASSHHTQSIGMVNTHARLRLLYGEKSGLSINSVAGEFTEVVVRLSEIGTGWITA